MPALKESKNNTATITFNNVTVGDNYMLIGSRDSTHSYFSSMTGLSANSPTIITLTGASGVNFATHIWIGTATATKIVLTTLGGNGAAALYKI